MSAWESRRLGTATATGILRRRDTSSRCFWSNSLCTRSHCSTAVLATDYYPKVYTVHTSNKSGQVFPAVFSLLPSKSTACYKMMWETIFEQVCKHCLLLQNCSFCSPDSLKIKPDMQLYSNFDFILDSALWRTKDFCPGHGVGNAEQVLSIWKS